MQNSKKSLQKTANKIAVFEYKKIRRIFHKGGFEMLKTHKLFFCFSFLVFSINLWSNSPMIDLRAAKKHIEQKFSKGIVETDPYPHLIIEDILPEELYQKMHDFWPESSCFSHQNGANRHLYVTKGCSEWMPLTAEQKLFWRMYGEVVIGYVKDEIKRILIPYLNWKFPRMRTDQLIQLTQTIKFFDSRQDSLMEHHYGYQIGHHIDQNYLFATGLLYCPTDNNHEHLSTLLYYPDTSLEPIPFDHCYQGPLKLAKKIPYRRNTLLVMLQNPWQLHASVLHTDIAYIRKTVWLIYTYNS